MSEASIPAAPLKQSIHSVANVFVLVGQNVLLYQHIETYLKLLLPHMTRTDGETSSDAFLEMKSLLESKSTMGPLVEQLKQSIQSSHPEEFASYVEAVVTNRNELTHGFLRLPFARLDNATACESAVQYLTSKHQFALPLFQSLRLLLATFVELLDEPAQLLSTEDVPNFV